MRRTLSCLMLIAVAAGAVSGCKRRAAKTREPMSDQEFAFVQLAMPGCGPHAISTADELILYCTEQAVFFGVRDIKERNPDKAIAGWLQELGERAGTQLDVLERTEVKTFGPLYTALYVRMRSPDMPPDGFVEAIVALTEVNGKPRRVWCSATSAEATGMGRCRQDLPNMALMEVPR